MLLDHVYLCKWKYMDLEEMRRDSELTDFIIGRIKTVLDKERVKQINDKG